MAHITLLKEHPEYAPILAFWAFREWYKTRTIPFDLVVKSYKERIDDSNMPVSWIAIEDGIPVGMVSLKKNDLWSRNDLSPWLASLYVLPEYRNRGIGDLLITRVKEKATELNFPCLYLFTDSDNIFLNSYYIKRGWKFLKEENGNDENTVKIYFYTIIS